MDAARADQTPALLLFCLCRRRRPSVHHGAVVYCAPDPVTRFGKLRRAADDAEIRARSLEWHIHNLVHTTMLHHDDPVRDQNCLIEIVRDKENGLAGTGMDIE